MKLELPRQLVFELSERFAKDILCVVHGMHNRVTYNGPIRTADAIFNERYFNECLIKTIRSVLRSIEDQWDRMSMVSAIKYHFLKLRTEKGTEIHWQDYVAKVRKFRETERRAA